MNRRLSVFNTFITEKVLTTIYYIIQHFDLIKDTFEKLYRNAITCHADNFVTREQNATLITLTSISTANTVRRIFFVFCFI